MSWSGAKVRLADLIAEFGRPSTASSQQAAAYPFTRLRADGIWTLDRDVPDDSVGQLERAPVTGRLDPAVEGALRVPGAVEAVARSLVESQFPMTVVPDVLVAVGLDPETVLAGSAFGPARARRNQGWPRQILELWDFACGFCQYDGRLGSAVVGIEAAHVRWFNLGGPDDLDNGLALCSLHHKLFDRGALGIGPDHSVVVSRHFTARTEVAKRVYDLRGHRLRARVGTPMPAVRHVEWHRSEVFKGDSLAELNEGAD